MRTADSSTLVAIFPFVDKTKPATKALSEISKSDCMAIYNNMDDLKSLGLQSLYSQALLRKLI